MPPWVSTARVQLSKAARAERNLATLAAVPQGRRHHIAKRQGCIANKRPQAARNFQPADAGCPGSGRCDGRTPCAPWHLCQPGPRRPALPRPLRSLQASSLVLRCLLSILSPFLLLLPSPPPSSPPLLFILLS